MVDFLSGLTAPQLQAVQAVDGPLLILAGSGTGKTRTLVYRLVSLLAEGVQPNEILMLTFSNSAAQELRNRAALLSDRADMVKMGTYHAIALRYVRYYGHLAGMEPAETIDRADAESLLTCLRKEIGLSKDFLKARQIYNLFSLS